MMIIKTSTILEQDFREFAIASTLLFGFRPSWTTLYAQCTHAQVSVLYCTTYWHLPSLEEVSLTLVNKFGTNTINTFLLCLPPHMLSSLSIWNIRCLIMCSKYCLHFSSRLCFVTKQEIEFFPCADIVSYFLLLLLVCDWPSVRWHLKIICCGSLCPKYQVRS